MIAIAGGGGVALLFCIMSLILVAMRRKKNRNNDIIMIMPLSNPSNKNQVARSICLQMFKCQPGHQ